MDTRLLEKYFKGACSPAEVAAVMAWFEKEELSSDQESDLYQVWQEAEQQQQEPIYTQEAARLFAGINQVLDQPETEPTHLPENSTSASARFFRSGAFKVVAAVLLPVCFGWLLFRFFAAEEKIISRLVTHSAVRGARETIRLSDGSAITLNCGSQITFPEPLAADKREITLQGEAFFEVAKDSLRPFIVRTGRLTTQALGTSFNIMYRVPGQPVAVALATGSVEIAMAIKARRQPVARLIPGQQLIYKPQEKTYVVAAYDAQEVLAWRKGILVFKKDNLHQVVDKLENWYGVEIEIEQKGAGSGRTTEWLYTGNFNNQQLGEVLAGISFVKDFTYEKKDNTWILNFK